MRKNHTRSTEQVLPLDVHTIRRENLVRLLREFSQVRIASGEPTNGTEKAFAEQLQMSKSLLSQLKSSRNISDAIAQQIETLCRKPQGYLSEQQSEVAVKVSVGEVAFLVMARDAYRNANREERAALRLLFQ